MPNKIVLAHYMPWFAASRNTSDTWRHWRGDRSPCEFDPEKIDERGHRRIASRYYPICGPYDSADPNVIDRHLWLMKDAGIDGIIVDWYGVGLMPDGKGMYADYNDLHKATMVIWDVVKNHPTKLKLALMLDGHALKRVCACNREKPSDYARRSLEFAADNFFAHDLYLKHANHCGNHPLLLAFGWPKCEPVTADEWIKIKGEITLQPLMLSENRHAAWADGAFFWPNPDAGCHQAAVRSWKRAIKCFTDFLPAPKPCRVVMGCAFPGFDDVYTDDNKNRVDRDEGKTYRETLIHALDNCTYVQIVTWNDWGEGTQIEPSVEFGDRELRTTRDLLDKYRSSSPAGSSASE